MRSKIFKTIAILLIIVIGSIAINLGVYEVSQDFGAIAAQQFNDDFAYTALKSQNGITTLIKIGHALFVIWFLYLGVKVWLPKKTD